MALASNSNSKEAEQAMIKSQQLLLKHNIELKKLDYDEEDKKDRKNRVLYQHERESLQSRSKRNSSSMSYHFLTIETFEYRPMLFDILKRTYIARFLNRLICLFIKSSLY